MKKYFLLFPLCFLLISEALSQTIELSGGPAYYIFSVKETPGNGHTEILPRNHYWTGLEINHLKVGKRYFAASLIFKSVEMSILDYASRHQYKSFRAAYNKRQVLAINLFPYTKDFFKQRLNLKIGLAGDILIKKETRGCSYNLDMMTGAESFSYFKSDIDQTNSKFNVGLVIEPEIRILANKQAGLYSKFPLFLDLSREIGNYRWSKYSMLLAASWKLNK